MNHEVVIETFVTEVGISEDRVTIVSEGIQGPPGPSGSGGGSGGVMYVAARALGGHRIVVLDGTGRADYADARNVQTAGVIIGMTTGAAEADSAVQVLDFGKVSETSWNWDTNRPVYLGQDGTLTQQIPEAPAAQFLCVVGHPSSPTSLLLKIQQPIHIA